MTVRCVECGTEIDTSEKRGGTKYCRECAHDVNLDRTKQRYHKKKEPGWKPPTEQVGGHFWKLVWAPPEHQDLLGVQFATVDFDYGDYRYLKGALMERAGKLYTFDGRRAREKNQ